MVQSLSRDSVCLRLAIITIITITIIMLITEVPTAILARSATITCKFSTFSSKISFKLNWKLFCSINRTGLDDLDDIPLRPLLLGTTGNGGQPHEWVMDGEVFDGVSLVIFESSHKLSASLNFRNFVSCNLEFLFWKFGSLSIGQFFKIGFDIYDLWNFWNLKSAQFFSTKLNGREYLLHAQNGKTSKTTK